MISVLIITKNDEDVIGDCINSVKELADEIIVVDGGSEDDTVEVAEKLGAEVVKNTFKDFSDQRDLALSLAKNEAEIELNLPITTEKGLKLDDILQPRFQPESQFAVLQDNRRRRDAPLA